MQRECKKHGLTDYCIDNKSVRCKKCRQEAVQRRRYQLKIMAIAYKGGCCSKCGYQKCEAAFDFHHLDPSKKDFSLSDKGITRSWKDVKEELDKCILLCSNCHRELHWDEGKENRDCLFSGIKHYKKLSSCDICPQCKEKYKPSSHRQKYCSRNCSKLSQQKDNKPTYRQLLEDIKVMKTIDIAKKYDVSISTISKWIRVYNNENC